MSIAAHTFDLVGIGIGPANLSLAALLHGHRGLSTVFVEQNPTFSWHAGLMLPGTQLQVHYLKDLVTPVDPTNPFSFPAFLVDTRRLYRLLITGRSRVPRKEFEEYYRWAADRLANLRFGVAAREVTWDGEAFVVHTTRGPLRTRNVVSGVGRRPHLPSCAAGADPDRVFHASTLRNRPRDFLHRRVAVVGGGQSGAEVVHHMLSSPTDRPDRIVWGTRRSNLLPLDESPFVNELFLPNYSRYFQSLSNEERDTLLDEQRMASDGVSIELLEALYRRLYDLEFLEDAGCRCRVLADQQLVGIDDVSGELLLTWRATRTGATWQDAADIVVCATGYEHGLPEPLAGLTDRLTLADGVPVVRSNFSLAFDGPLENRIFVQNAARRHFGVADPNLSLVAWRSAVIVNNLVGYEMYDTGPVSAALEWGVDEDRKAENGGPVSPAGLPSQRLEAR